MLNILQNAFSRFTKFGLNVFILLVVDLLHEFELGIWKALFAHLIRILQADNADLEHVLNERFVRQPRFCYLPLKCAQIQNDAHLRKVNHPRILR